MAKEEKSLSEKKAKPARGGRFLKGIINIPKRMWNAILNTIAELKKVTWPSRKDLINYTAIVLAFMVLMALVVGLLDLGASRLISLIIRRA
ncbi:MAG: preprotein translocase subunit SecE [Oscillospiraceae bacterium]|jgi:preprotein translocase subunit SecE|nr:preprotein translocase subunit SecE [Oscillospiraceae bacterium]